MRPYRALFLVIFAILMLAAGGTSARAQDAIPETPPELRDFRLDPQRPQPEPTPEPSVAPPPVVSTVPERTQPETTAPTQRQPARRQPAAAPPAATTEPEAAASASQEATPPDVEQTEPVALPEARPPVASPSENAAAWDYSLIAGISGAALIAVIGLWLALRRRRRQPEEVAPDEPVAEPVMPRPFQAPAPKPVSVPTPPIVEKPDIALAFIPEKATVSFTTLTVKGQLQIENDGKAMASDMRLRAGLVSASSQQQQAINAFFAATDIASNALGDAKPGEKLAMSIELTVPLTEMQSFPLGDQRLLVPIMVAELACTDEKGAEQHIRLACMLGRESQPPQSKMGPLRLDQGPRSFAPLGQRPIYT